MFNVITRKDGRDFKLHFNVDWMTDPGLNNQFFQRTNESGLPWIQMDIIPSLILLQHFVDSNDFSVLFS